MLRTVLLVLVCLALSGSCSAQSDTDVFKLTSSIQTLGGQLGTDITDTAEPYKSGDLSPATVGKLLTDLGADKTKTTIIHLLRWKDPDHTQVKFQKWFLYDPTPSKLTFYLQSEKEVFQRTAIPGRKDFQFIYIHLNAVLANGPNEWQVVGAGGTTLKHPVNYTVTVSKQQTQFLQDLKSTLQILGVLAAASEVVKPGYYSVSTFQSQWTTSSISITGTLDSKNESKAATATQKDASNQIASKTYTNERPSWIGLSAGVPLTTYKDITFQSSSGTLIPNSITKQDVYIFLDGYLPPVLPTLTGFRYLPHPFFGLPIKGEVLRHSMVGAGIGLHWIEPFGGFIFDTQNNAVKGPTTHKNQLTIQPVFGIKVSISAAAKALKGSKGSN